MINHPINHVEVLGFLGVQLDHWGGALIGLLMIGLGLLDYVYNHLVDVPNDVGGPQTSENHQLKHHQLLIVS